MQPKEIKGRVSIEGIGLIRKENIIKIKLKEGDGSHWLFKFASLALAEKWSYLFYQLQ